MEFQLEQWHWWVLTLGFVVCIAMSPKLIFILLTLATSVVGSIVWFNAATPIKIQLIIFSFIMITGYVVSLYFFNTKSSKHQTDQLNGQEEAKPGNREFLNREESEAQHTEIVGRTFTLEEPMVGGVGTLNFDNQRWRLRGKDAGAGSIIRIVSVDGIDQTLLEVELLEAEL